MNRLKTKYPIKKEFFPFNMFTASIDVKTIRQAQRFMGVPGFLWKDPALHVEMREIPAYEGGSIELYLIRPKEVKAPMPCFIDIHGGGFVFEGFTSHFRLAMRYAKGAQCMVIYVRYRLAPDHPFPVPQEDCYAALQWVYRHAEELGLDRDRIGIGGDSAGGALAVTSCLIALDRGEDMHPLFQLLIYPWLDDRNNSPSYLRYTDTPMWNSTLSKKVSPIIDPHPEKIPLYYRSPIESDALGKMPPAYIEVAEFDCLHDDGVLYAKRLREEGVSAVLLKTKGTMHGFDTKVNAPTAKRMTARRITYMRKLFRVTDQS